MTLGDILLFVSFGLACYFLGRASMMHTIIRAVVEEAGEELKEKESTELGALNVEKINNVYYAYVGGDFAGQADNFEDLVSNMKKDKRFQKFKITGIDTLTKEEQADLAQALHKNYNVNK